MDYSGKINLLGKKYHYIIKGYEMTIVNTRIDILRNHKLSEITNKWIETETNEEKKLVVKLSYKNARDDAIIMKIDAYFNIIDLEYKREKMKDEIRKLTYRSDVLDYFFRPNKKYIKLVSNLIQTFDNGKLKKENFKKYEFYYNNKKFIMYFGINSYLRTNERFMFDVFSSLNIECDDNITFDEVYEISMYVKKFLSFISNTRKVYFDEVMINGYFNESKYKYGYFYLNHGDKESVYYMNVLNYDDVMNTQREIIYKRRNEILDKDSIRDRVLTIFKDYVVETVNDHFVPEDVLTHNDIVNICEIFNSNLLKSEKLVEKDLENKSIDEVQNTIYDIVVKDYNEKLKDVPKEIQDDFEKAITLRVLDKNWMNQLDNMEQLKEGIGLRGYAQTNPLQAYALEGFQMFDNMLKETNREITTYLLKAEVRQNLERHENKNIKTNDSSESTKKTPKKAENKIGRNDPCPCGSGKKYKNCHGR